jgi:predicted phosphodiesterase
MNNKKQEQIISSILSNYSDKELELLANKSTLIRHKTQTKEIGFDGETFRIGFITDTHMGSIHFDENWYNSAVKEMIDKKVNFVCHAGDIVDGHYSQRLASQIYELSHIGYNAQKQYAVEMLNKIPFPVYIISGNHDITHHRNTGALIVKDIADSLEHVTYLGHDEGNLNINGVSIKMWHGGDTSSYASSYRVQKLIESFTGGEKPQLLLCGHTHKMVYLFERNIHAFSGGALCKQSTWMRGKRLANHSGFWIIDVTVKKKSIVSCSGTFHNFYI